MFLRRIVEWIDSLESVHQFRKWAALSIKISGVFTLVTTFVLGIVILTLVLMFTRRSGIVTQAFAIIGTFFGFVIIGTVGITMAMLFWDRAKKIASLGEESHLTFGAISGDLMRLLGEVAFIGFSGAAILFLVCSIFGAMMLGWIVLVLLALSFLFHFLGAGILQFSYVMADISMNIKQVEPTLSRDVTAATVPEVAPPESPLEGKSTPNNDEHSPEIIAEQDAETHTNGYPYPESEGKLSIIWRLFVTLITCFIYGIFWKSKQMSILNGWLGRETLSFWKTVGLGLLTCGVYSIYVEYQMACSIKEIRDKYGMYVNSSFPAIYMLSLFFTLSIGAYAIMQSEINKLYDEYPND